MSYNILGINPFHNGSACVLSDGEIIYFLEEERLSKHKYDANPFRVILDILNRFEINEVSMAGINTNDVLLSYTFEDPFYALIRKFYPKLKFTFLSDQHHLMHSFHSYFNSGFKNSLNIIIDAGGSSSQNKGIEMDSIYEYSPSTIKNLYKYYSPNINPQSKKSTNIGSSYSLVNKILGFNNNEEGKTMGLSSYGNYNPTIPKIYKGNTSDINVIWEEIDYEQRRVFNFNTSLIDIPLSTSKSKNFTKVEKDLAWRIQNDSQQLVGDLVEKHLKETGLRHVCCTGGFFLNCVANYYLTKRFPDIKFYFEPISSDAGTAIGAAYFRWKELNPNFISSKQKTLYYGPKYSKEELLEGIKKYT
jgi:carbamoyltransferase